MGANIPLACQDWANTKGAYRFFSNDRVSEEEILAGHFQSTPAPSLQRGVPSHDRVHLSKSDPSKIGVMHSLNCGKDSMAAATRTLCGLLMHLSLAVTSKGCRLATGRSSSGQGRSSREPFRSRRRSIRRGCPSKRRSIRWLENMRQAKAQFADPVRCIHVGDRESGTYGLFCTAHEFGTHFLVRSCVDRSATARAKPRLSLSRSSIAATVSCRRWANRSVTPFSISRCCTRRSATNQSIGQGWIGS